MKLYFGIRIHSEGERWQIRGQLCLVVDWEAAQCALQVIRPYNPVKSGLPLRWTDVLDTRVHRGTGCPPGSKISRASVQSISRQVFDEFNTEEHSLSQSLDVRFRFRSPGYKALSQKNERDVRLQE